MKLIRNSFKFLFLSAETAVILMFFANFWVYAATHGRSYTKVSKVPPRACALVLGTSPKTRAGNANLYFTSRMEAVALLYHYGKVKKIIVSGEKSPYYNEPKAMKEFLVYKEGVPEESIIEDPKGFSTQKSILRCKEEYRENDVIIVSQGFHNLRALFFARNQNMNALGFDAEDVTKNESFYRNHFREFLAKSQAVVYYLLGV